MIIALIIDYVTFSTFAASHKLKMPFALKDPDLFFRMYSPLVKMPRLSEVELDKEISEEEYKKELRHLQKKLNALHYRLYRKKIPVVIAYEEARNAAQGRQYQAVADTGSPEATEVHPIGQPGTTRESETLLLAILNETS